MSDANEGFKDDAARTSRYMRLLEEDHRSNRTGYLGWAFLSAVCMAGAAVAASHDNPDAGPVAAACGISTLSLAWLRVASRKDPWAAQTVAQQVDQSASPQDFAQKVELTEADILSGGQGKGIVNRLNRWRKFSAYSEHATKARRMMT